MYIYIYISRYLYVYILYYIVCMHACMHVCMYACMHACMHACYVCMHAMYVCMYCSINVYVYLYIYTYTCINVYILYNMFRYCICNMRLRDYVSHATTYSYILERTWHNQTLSSKLYYAFMMLPLSQGYSCTHPCLMLAQPKSATLNIAYILPEK